MTYRLSFIIICALLLGACSSTPDYYQPEVQTLDQLEQSVQPERKLAIAFGGGGVRGFVHLGVIKALEEAGIRADVVTGSSIGAVAAALYASGKSYAEIERIALNFEGGDIVEFAPQHLGLLEHKNIAQWIEQQTGVETLEQLAIPIGVTVTQLNRREPLLVTDGELGKAIQASTTVPGTFVPLVNSESLWLDGGLLSNLPVRFAKSLGADHVVGVDIYCGEQHYSAENALRVLLASSRLQSCTLAVADQQAADVLIQPNFEPQDAKSFAEREQAIEAGYQATLKALPAIQKLIASP